MTHGERLIWAAVYAQHYLTGTTVGAYAGHTSTIDRAANAARIARQALGALTAAHETGTIAQDDAHADAEEMLR